MGGGKGENKDCKRINDGMKVKGLEKEKLAITNNINIITVKLF